MSDLSAIVVTWNGWPFLERCLRSLEANVRAPGRIAMEVIVVDNGSEDATLESLAREFPWAEAVAMGANRGFAAAVNAGLARASGRYAVLLNNDTVVPEGAFEACIAYLDANADAGVAGPQLRSPDGKKQNSVHAEPSLVGEIVPGWLLETLFPDRFPSKRFEHAAPLDVDAVLGACLFLRRSLLPEVGVLSEDYFFFLEETDFCRAVRAAGHRVVHLPQVEVTHVHGATSKKRDPARTRIEYHRSLYRYFRKNRGVAALAAVVAIRFAKSVLHVVVGAPGALFSERGRERWRARWRVLSWHLRGGPEGWGMAPVERIQAG